MISRIKGVLLHREASRVEVETRSGVVYEIEVPLTVSERLPRPGSEVEIRTVYLVREDAVSLFGFLSPEERALFVRLLSASGVGGRLALAMLSTFPAGRLARAIAEKDVAALTQISGVGKKTAERIALELSDKVADLVGAPVSTGSGDGAGAQEAVKALVALGHSFQEADRAVRQVLDEEEPASTEALIRKALARG